MLTYAGLAEYARAAITPQNMLCSLQNGLYFVNIYRNITDINFPPVTYVYTLQMQQKEKKIKSRPSLRDLSHREQSSSQ